MASAFNEGSPTKSTNTKKAKKKVAQKEERKEQPKQATGKVISTTSSKGTWVFTRSDK